MPDLVAQDLRKSIDEGMGVRLSFILAWTAAIVLWAMLCAAGWFIAVRGDYARLALAHACEAKTEQARLTDPECAAAGSSAANFAEINRKARISRLAAAGGGVVAVLIIIMSRRGQPKG